MPLCTTRAHLNINLINLEIHPNITRPNDKNTRKKFFKCYNSLEITKTNKYLDDKAIQHDDF